VDNRRLLHELGYSLITDADYATIPLIPHDWHGKWNYDIAGATV
jgi:hypothetical protein